MAFLCGFFGLAIFPCLFYYDEALRRDVDDEDLSSNEFSKFRQMSSNELELRDAKTDAKLVRSHDASLFFKKGKGKTSKPTSKPTPAPTSQPTSKSILSYFGGKRRSVAEETSPSCRVTVGDTACDEGRVTPRCCEEMQALVCSSFEDVEASWKHPLCDKFKGREANTTVWCTTEAEKALMEPDGQTCSSAASLREAQKRLLIPVIEGSICRVKVGDTTCEDQKLTSECCEEMQVGVCQLFKDVEARWKHPLCDEFDGREFNEFVCSTTEGDMAALTKTGTCQTDAFAREFMKAIDGTSTPTSKPTSKPEVQDSSKSEAGEETMNGPTK